MNSDPQHEGEEAQPKKGPSRRNVLKAAAAAVLAPQSAGKIIGDIASETTVSIDPRKQMIALLLKAWKRNNELLSGYTLQEKTCDELLHNGKIRLLDSLQKSQAIASSLKIIEDLNAADKKNHVQQIIGLLGSPQLLRKSQQAPADVDVYADALGISSGEYSQLQGALMLTEHTSSSMLSETIPLECNEVFSGIFKFGRKHHIPNKDLIETAKELLHYGLREAAPLFKGMEEQAIKGIREGYDKAIKQAFKGPDPEDRNHRGASSYDSKFWMLHDKPQPTLQESIEQHGHKPGPSRLK